ncbi:MAG: helix-turn-helix domain-containing protein, partial [Bacteroidota bacterium]
NYDWPGNVRELEHVIEGATVLSQGDTIDTRDLWVNAGLISPQPSPTPPARTPEQPAIATPPDSQEQLYSLEEVERIHIEKALRHNNWNRLRTAQLLGITPKTLYLKIKKYGLKNDR